MLFLTNCIAYISQNYKYKVAIFVCLFHRSVIR
jgi:hypothetical protein